MKPTKKMEKKLKEAAIQTGLSISDLMRLCIERALDDVVNAVLPCVKK